MKFKVLLFILLTVLAYSKLLRRLNTKQGGIKVLQALLSRVASPGEAFYIFCIDTDNPEDLCIYDLNSEHYRVIKLNELAVPPTYYKETGTWNILTKPTSKPELEPGPYVVYCRFDDVIADFISEILGFKYLISALNYFDLADLQTYLYLKDVYYNSFVYLCLLNKYRITTQSDFYLKKDFFIKFAEIFNEGKLNSSSAKNIRLNDILNVKKLKILQTILSYEVNLDLFALIIDFQTTERLRPPKQIQTGQLIQQIQIQPDKQYPVKQLIQKDEPMTQPILSDQQNHENHLTQPNQRYSVKQLVQKYNNVATQPIPSVLPVRRTHNSQIRPVLQETRPTEIVQSAQVIQPANMIQSAQVATPIQAEQFKLEMLKEIVMDASKLGKDLIDHLISIINIGNTAFSQFFADGLRSLKDFRFLQSIVSFESDKQDFLLKYITKSNLSDLDLQKEKLRFPESFFDEIEEQETKNGEFIRLLVDLLNYKPLSKPPTDIKNYKIASNQKIANHLKEIKSIFCHETLEKKFTPEKFKIVKDLFHYYDHLAGGILKVAISEYSLESSMVRCKNVLNKIPDKTILKQITNLLEANKDELEILTKYLLGSGLARSESSEFRKLKTHSALTANQAFALGTLFKIDQNDSFWTNLKDYYRTIDNEKINLNLEKNIMSKEVNNHIGRQVYMLMEYFIVERFVPIPTSEPKSQTSINPTKAKYTIDEGGDITNEKKEN
jgi:hypothetical protein